MFNSWSEDGHVVWTISSNYFCSYFSTCDRLIRAAMALASLRICTVHLVKDAIVIYRIHETFLFLRRSKPR